MRRQFLWLLAMLSLFLLALSLPVSFALLPFCSAYMGVNSKLVLVFWSWFPLGACGFRTILLFFSCLAIFILRVGQMRMGTRTTSSPFSSARQALFSLSTFQTFGWYLLSAWWFTEVSMWSSSESADLNWVKLGKSVNPVLLRKYLG